MALYEGAQERNKKVSEMDIKKQLEKGAAEIRKAQQAQKAEASKNDKIDFVESTRPMNEIWKERVEVLNGSLGLKIADDTPIGECMRIIDKVEETKRNVGWMLGDVLNFAGAKYGHELFQRLLNQTGRAYSTLAGYAEVAKAFPVSQRIRLLDFSSHREIIGLPDVEKRKALLNKISTEIKQGKTPGRQEIRERVAKLKPKKAATKSVKKAIATCKPNPIEKAKLVRLRKLISPARVLLIALTPLLKKLPDSERSEWQRLLTPFANLCDDL